jgi:ATP-dependent RNA helicase DDX55/SPB4
VELISERIYSIISSDRDNVEKAKRAFVSYIRAYKEHDLKYIFEFKNVDIGMVAHSFFLYRIPRVKEILGKSFSSFVQSEVDIEAIPWLDKNQQMQFQAKQEHREQERRARDAVKETPSSKNIKNIKSQRKKVKRRNQANEMQILNKEHKAVLKDRNHSKFTPMQEDSEDYDEDTEQIEQRIQQRNN